MSCTFPLTIRPRPFEPAHAAIVRLAQRWGAADASSFARTRGFPIARLAAGKDVSFLAENLGHDPRPMVEASPLLDASARLVRLHGEQFRLGDWSMRSRRRCPACVEEDVQEAVRLSLDPESWATSRSWWDIGSIRSCPYHDLELVDRCHACGTIQTWRQGLLVCVCGALQTSRHASPDHSSASRYILGRLNYAPKRPTPVLDLLRADHAVRAMELLGATRLPWAATKPRRAQTEAGQDREVGYAMASQWPGAFLRQLDAVVAERAGSSGLIETYGWIYSELCVGDVAADFAAVISPVLREHAVRNRIIARDEERLGHTPPPTITATRTARLLGRSYATTRKLLEGIDAIPDGSRRSVAFAIQPCAAENLPPARQVEAAHKTLQIGRKQARRLMNSGVVPYQADATSSGRAHQVLTALRSLAQPARRRHTPLPVACRNMSVPIASACAGILSGRLRAVRRGDASCGLHGLGLDQAELKAFRAPRTSLNVEEIARISGFHSETARFLLRSGQLGPVNDHGQVSKRALESFQSRFVLASTLAPGGGSATRALCRALAQSGITPAFAPPDCRQIIFRRSDLPDRP